MKRQPTEWEKISANDVTNMYVCIHTHTHTQFIHLNIKRNLKMDRRTEQTLFHRRNTNGQQAQEKTLNTTNHWGNVKKHPVRYHLTPTCQNGYHQKDQQKVGEGVEKRECLYTVGGNIYWCSHYGKQYGAFSKNYKWNYYMIQKFYSWVYI